MVATGKNAPILKFGGKKKINFKKGILKYFNISFVMLKLKNE